jgi:DNA-directed RNA polymerase sigma subunit (sigma70/sigma32)
MKNKSFEEKMDHESFTRWGRRQRVEILMSCVHAFTVRDHDLHEIIHQRYALKRTWREIADSLNLTIEQVRHKHRVAMHKIRHELDKEK